MALSTRRKKILAWYMYLLEASNDFLRTLLEKVVGEEPLLDERSLRKRRPRRHEEEGDKLVQALLLCSADQRLLRRLIADRLKRRFWAAPRRDAVWESQFLGTFRVVGHEYGKKPHDQPADWIIHGSHLAPKSCVLCLLKPQVCTLMIFDAETQEIIRD